MIAWKNLKRNASAEVESLTSAAEVRHEHARLCKEQVKSTANACPIHSPLNKKRLRNCINILFKILFQLNVGQ